MPALQGAPTSRRAAQREDDDLFDDEGDLVAANDAQSETRHILSISPHFTSRLAGPNEAAAMVLGSVVDLGAQPSSADLQVLSSYICQADDVPAAVLLAAALDRLPELGAADCAPQLRQELADLCSSHDVDLDAAIDGVLRKNEPELGDIGAEVAEMLQMAGL